MAAETEQFTGDENDQEELGSEDGDGTNRKSRLTDKKKRELKQKKEKTSQYYRLKPPPKSMISNIANSGVPKQGEQ